MEKLKGYLGLSLVLAMLILFKTLPSNYPYSTTLTPFDNNVVTRLALQGSSDLKLWQNATNALGFCRGKEKGKSQGSYYYGSYDCAKQLSQNIYAYPYLGDLYKLNPELAVLTRDYLRDYSAKNEEKYPNEPSIVFYHREFSSTILEYIKSIQSKLRKRLGNLRSRGDRSLSALR